MGTAAAKQSRLRLRHPRMLQAAIQELLSAQCPGHQQEPSMQLPSRTHLHLQEMCMRAAAATAMLSLLL
jgi:hypothetical protein